MLPIALIRLLIRRQLVGERSKRVNFVSYFSFFFFCCCLASIIIERDWCNHLLVSQIRSDGFRWPSLIVAGVSDPAGHGATQENYARRPKWVGSAFVLRQCPETCPSRRRLFCRLWWFSSPTEGTRFSEKNVCFVRPVFMTTMMIFWCATKQTERERYTHEQNATE